MAGKRLLTTTWAGPQKRGGGGDPQPSGRAGEGWKRVSLGEGVLAHAEEEEGDAAVGTDAEGPADREPDREGGAGRGRGGGSIPAG